MMSSLGSHPTPSASDSCADGLVVERWQDILTFIMLGIINLFVIVGNMLVIIAVFAFKKLRTVTNFFIVSLAVADLLVGVAVLPYSITLEVLGVWIFGAVWCQMWLAVDVWMCTSSILNLCAISIDRYIAIKKPVHYRNIMTKGKAKLLIAAVWVLSFLICFPPLVGWNDQGSNNLVPQNDSDVMMTITVPDATPPLHLPPSFQSETRNRRLMEDIQRNTMDNQISLSCSFPECTLINNMGYVIYSALGSFYIPLIVMLFFYWQIYCAAIKTSRALERGFKRTKSTKKHKSHKGQSTEVEDEQSTMLRIHRGPKYTEVRRSGSDKKMYTNGCRAGLVIITTDDDVTIATTDASPRLSRNNNGLSFRIKSKKEKTNKKNQAKKKKKLSIESDSGDFKETTASNMLLSVGERSKSEDNLSIKSSKSSYRSFFRTSSTSARFHAKRFRSEAKATKTVGVIVGGFICCWLPFFIIYLIRAFCEDCFPQLLFSVFFWLGYCNSAINPLIYAHFSKDFRSAFKKILFRCHCTEDGVSSLIRQIHMTTFFEDNCDDNIQDSH